MAKYRNVSGTALTVDLGNGRFASVEAGDIVEIPDSDRYVQTGETGETPLFEAVTAPTTLTKKSATAAKE